MDTLRDDLQTVLCLESLGLSLNTSKSEIIADNTTTYDIFSLIFIMSIPLLLLSWAPLWVIWTVSLLPFVLKSLIFQLLGTIYSLLLLMTLLFYYDIRYVHTSDCSMFFIICFG